MAVIGRILLDMDEVLCDFVGAAARDWGVSMPVLLAHHDRNEWAMVDSVRKARVTLGLHKPDEPLTNQQFWDRINTRFDFWINLQPFPWMWSLVAWAAHVTDKDFQIVSSPSLCATCYDGKVRWLKNTFGEQFNRFALTPHKEIFAQPGVLLIDDRPENCEKFRAAGGMAIRFPHQLYSPPEDLVDPVGFVKEQYDRL